MTNAVESSHGRYVEDLSQYLIIYGGLHVNWTTHLFILHSSVIYASNSLGRLITLAAHSLSLPNQFLISFGVLLKLPYVLRPFCIGT